MSTKKTLRTAFFMGTVLAGGMLADAVSGGSVAAAQAVRQAFNFEEQDLTAALRQYALQTGRQVTFSETRDSGVRTAPLKGMYSPDEAIQLLLRDTPFDVATLPRGVMRVYRAEQPARVHKIGAVTAVTQFAQAAPIPAPSQEVEGVIVSSSRITARGFSAPTPTTVVSAADLQATAQPNIFDAIAQLPSLQGSVGTQSNAGNFSTGANGLSSFNLRGLGTIRALTLIDGQRVVPANITGISDISQFPQLLIQRVDVVNGGASASWGSDAIGGVVNFVTDKNFKGVKGNVQIGQSKYNDYKHALIQLAAGTALFGGKGHFEVATELYANDGVPAGFTPGGALSNGRCCNVIPGMLSYTTTTTPAGQPQFTPIYGAQNNVSSEWGLISTGPLRGTAFDFNGQPTQFQFGSPCVGTVCVGGDLSNTAQKTSVDNPITRAVLYSRLSYNLTPGIEVYSTFNYAKVGTDLSPPQGNRTGLVIPCGNNVNGANYYVPASVNAQCVANNLTTFTLGVSYDKFPPTHMKTYREQRRYVVGTDGTFDAFGKDWSFDAYYQHGENSIAAHVSDIFLNARYNAAVDAIAGPNGTVICRSATARASGCVPFNVMGGAPPSEASFAYFNAPGGKGGGPYSYTDYRQEAASVSVNGTPFKNWAGDVALAMGAEFREEAYTTRSDPWGDGVSATNPNTSEYPADPLLDAVNGNNWFAANFHHGSGKYHVQEVFVETGIPLFTDTPFGTANLNVAGRATWYSTSGEVNTWKIGSTWDTPLSGFRVRAMQSSDVRAPNLSELFAAPITTNNGVTNRLLPATAPNVNVLNIAIGNPDLEPEIARTTELGVVFRPDFAPGLALSVDYYKIALRKQIGVLTNQQEIDLCQLYGNTSYCDKFFLGGAQGTSNPSYVYVQPFNLATTDTDGYDIEASYQLGLDRFHLPGRLVLRALANHVNKFTVNTGVPGQPIADFVGAQISASPAASRFQAGVPTWKVVLSQNWNVGKLGFNVTERFFSDTVFDPNGIVCQAPNCPAPTAQNPTYAYMDVPGYFYVDIGGRYDISDRAQAYFKVDNVGDTLPKPFALLNSDPIGRVYRVGVRFNF